LCEDRKKLVTHENDDDKISDIGVERYVTSRVRIFSEQQSKRHRDEQYPSLTIV